jgi:arginase
MRIPVTPVTVIVEAPTNLGLRPPMAGREPGVRGLPEALEAHGLRRRLGARLVGRVEPGPYSPHNEPATGFRNGAAIAAHARALAEVLDAPLRRGDFIVLLGGDCSVLLGAGLALRRVGRFGLAHVDGHDDFAPPRGLAPDVGRAAAGLDLALVTGRGPLALTSLDGQGPSFREEDVVQLGFAPEPGDDPMPFGGTSITAFSAAQLRREGVERVGAQALARLKAHTERFWVHLDVDVLAASVMPAVDSPNPAGLTFAQLEDLLAALLADQGAAGLEVTIFDPELDPDGRLAAQLVELLVAVFERTGRVNAR